MKRAYFGRCLILTAVILVCVRPAHATSIELTFTGADSWTASWTDPGLTLVYTPGTPNSLVKTLSFSTLDPVAITFTENSTATSDNFGFRLTMSEVITNNTGFAWSGFTESLIEGNPTLVAPFASPAHPSPAHFHTDPGFSGSPFLLIGGGNAQTFLQFGGGTVADGGTWNAIGIGIHEWQVNGFRRSFTLIETPIAAPVPEPSSLVLCLGCLPLAWRKCREHARNRHRR